MNYFVNESLAAVNSGIEHAEFERMKLFKDHATPAKIILKNWNRNLHQNMENAGIENADVINMWDHLQEAIDVPRKEIHLEDLDFPDTYFWDRQSDFADIYDGDAKLAEVRFRGGEIGVVDYVQFLDPFGNTTRLDFYDYRGFKSLTQHYDRNDVIAIEEMYSPSGKKVSELYYRKNAEKEIEITDVELLDFAGQQYSFDNLDQLLRFFLDYLNRQNGEDSVFISDRRNGVDWAVANMQSKAHKYAMLHGNHMTEAKKKSAPELDKAYELPLVTGTDLLDGVIVATQQQKQDIITQFGSATNILVIPSAVVFDELLNLPHLPQMARNRGRMVTVARRFPDKQLDQLIRAVAIVKRSLPEIQLDIYGDGDGKTNVELDNLVKELKLESTVRFNNYVLDISSVYNTAVMEVSTNATSSLTLPLVEGAAHGLPLIAYDVNYGPSTVIKEDVNGYLVRPDDIKALANQIIKVLRFTPNEWQRMSDNAYNVAKQQFSESTIWPLWTQIVD